MADMKMNEKELREISEIFKEDLFKKVVPLLDKAYESGYRKGIIDEAKKDKGFIFHASWGEVIENLDVTECGELYKMMLTYAYHDRLNPSENPRVNMAFDRIKKDMDWDKAHPLRYVDYTCDHCAHLDICWQEGSKPYCKSDKFEAFCSQDIMGDC